MNGRLLFEKYSRLIESIVVAEKLLPKKIREIQFNRIRNKHGKIAMLRRFILLKTLAKNVGNNVAVFPGVYFENIENLLIGSNVSIHQMCYIDAEGGIEIGNNVSIAHRSTILSSNHGYKDTTIPIKYQKMILGKVILDDDIWIGCGCTILAGVHIETGCVVGSNSTITHDLEANSIAVGSPAKIIRKRV